MNKRVKKLCDRVQKLLRLDDRRAYYITSTEEGTDNYAVCSQPSQGNSIIITFYPDFFRQSLEQQLSVIIHEHIHVITTMYTQNWNCYREYMPEPYKSLYDRGYSMVDEQVTCVLEGILFDFVIKDKKIQKILKGK